MVWGFIGVALVSLILLVCDLTVVSNASGRTFDTLDDVPRNTYGVLLATSPKTREGKPNYYYAHRIQAAEQLYKAGKVDTIIASGGNYVGTQKYGFDEPACIKRSLMLRGIPEDRILLDYDGQRTLKSVRNAKERYGLDSLTFISQKYHNERAIYLADREGISAVGYNARTSPVLRSRIKNTLREYLARVKMFLE